MSTSITISLPPDEAAQLDRLCRHQRASYPDAVYDAIRWYIELGGNLQPLDDPTEDHA